MGERVSVSGRVDEDVLDDFEDWVEAHEEYGNKSAAIEGLIEDVVGEVPTRVTDGREENTPDDTVLNVVYEAALDHVGDDHLLREEMVSSVAKTVNNNSAHDLSPDADAIRQFLTRLENEGYAYHTFWTASLRATKTTSRWRIKPLGAEPDLWRYNADNVEEREKRIEQRRTDRLLGRTSGGEASAD